MHVPLNDAVCVDAGNTKHEDGGGDENDVEAGESDEDAVDRVLHLGPEHQVCLITAWIVWAVSQLPATVTDRLCLQR